MLAGAAADRDQRAAMDIFEIAKRKFGAPFGIFAMTIVNSEMPFGEFSEAMRPNEIVFGFGGWLIIGPGTVFIGNKMAGLDQFLGKMERIGAKPDLARRRNGNSR